MSSLNDILSPAALADVDNYQLLAKVVVEGFMAGQHRSLFHGTGSEFVQYRDYSPGDELKYVDWKAFARRDRLYSKVFEEETNMDCAIILDTSASMGYQGARADCAKIRYAAMIAACLAYLASRQGDNIGFSAYAEELLYFFPADRPAKRLKHIFTALSGLSARGSAEHGKHLSFIAESMRKRGMVVVISDFLEAEHRVPDLLNAFRFKGKETIVIQVLDPDEVDFPFTGARRFQDSETHARVSTSPATVREDYTRAMREAMTTLKDACHASQVDCLQVTTDQSLGIALAAYLHRRGAVF
ncbi:MAG: DUF58 domain-containing protein [Lentisphaeria bacterium]|nr:DUF58 domain-containing protein [Lentisphaeria bacterium]